MSENQKSWDIAVAEKFKERENPSPIGPVLGKILKSLPNISIELLNGYGVIDSDKIYLSNAVTNRLEIECTIKNFESQGNTSKIWKSSDNSVSNLTTNGGGDASSLLEHEGSLKSLSAKNTKSEQENKEKGKFILQTVFHLEPGMFVLVIPNFEEDKFFIVDVFNYAPEVSLEWEYYQK